VVIDTVEQQVFRSIQLDPSKFYGFAFYSNKKGTWPNETYWTEEPIEYLGRWISSDRWGSRDQSGGAENFEHKRIVYDYEGKTSFVEMSEQ